MGWVVGPSRVTCRSTWHCLLFVTVPHVQLPYQLSIKPDPNGARTAAVNQERKEHQVKLVQPSEHQLMPLRLTVLNSPKMSDVGCPLHTCQHPAMHPPYAAVSRHSVSLRNRPHSQPQLERPHHPLVKLVWHRHHVDLPLTVERHDAMSLLHSPEPLCLLLAPATPAAPPQ